MERIGIAWLRNWECTAISHTFRAEMNLNVQKLVGHLMKQILENMQNTYVAGNCSLVNIVVLNNNIVVGYYIFCQRVPNFEMRCRCWCGSSQDGRGYESCQSRESRKTRDCNSWVEFA
jgi:hypothetical protein